MVEVAEGDSSVVWDTRRCAGSHPWGSWSCFVQMLRRPSPVELPMAHPSFLQHRSLAIPSPHPYVSQLVSFGIASSRDFEIHHTSTFFTVKLKPVL